MVQLAKAGAHQLGRRIPIADIDAQVLNELEIDGIVRSVRAGHTVQFSHDIFFEWAFLQHLVRTDGDWPDVILEIGEPPALGRVGAVVEECAIDPDLLGAGVDAERITGPQDDVGVLADLE